MDPRFAMVAGEASGDLLAGLLMQGLRARWPAFQAQGIGGQRMREQGFEAWWPTEKLAVRGYVEVLRVYRELEMPLVPVLAAMEHMGIRVAPQRLEVLAKELERQLDALLHEIHQLAGEPVNPNSPKQLAAVLFEKLKLPPVRRTKTGYSTDVDVLEELAVGHPLPQKILDYRAEHGPFRSVDDLDAVPGIGPTRIEQLRDLVTP